MDDENEVRCVIGIDPQSVNPRATPPLEFFELNARYDMDSGAQRNHLLEDASCFLGAGLGVLWKQFAPEGDDTGNAFWAAASMLRQAKAALQATICCMDAMTSPTPEPQR